MSENVGASTSRDAKSLQGLYRDKFTLPLSSGRLVKAIMNLRIPYSRGELPDLLSEK
jgi:hypothetical protein